MTAHRVRPAEHGAATDSAAPGDGRQPSGTRQPSGAAQPSDAPQPSGARMLAATVRVPVHTLDGADVRELPVVVHHVDPATSEVLIDGTVLGFIRFDGHHFVALAGRSPEAALEQVSADLWDQALGALYAAWQR